MTVYVDDMKAPHRPKHRPGVVYIMCHMIADTEAEMHTMAGRIGVAKQWYQGDHYDITLTKRAIAVRLGAKEITWRQLGIIAIAKRHATARLPGGPLAGQSPCSCTTCARFNAFAAG